MKRPMTAFDRIAKASERTRSGLGKYPEVDEIVVRLVFDPSEIAQKGRIDPAAKPEKRIGERTFFQDGAPKVRRCWRYGQINTSISPSRTAPEFPVSTFVR